MTCIVNHVFPQVGWAVANVLERAGATVEVPGEQTCCGQPAFNAGFWDDARQMARHTIDVLEDAEGPVVVPSGSCADMMVHHYAHLLKDDPLYGPKAKALSGRVYEFSQYLVDELGMTDLGARHNGKVAYHSSCHLLRGLGLDRQARQLLADIDGAEVVDLHEAETCCGFGGLFAVKMGDISTAMLGRKMDSVRDSGADTLTGCDMSCLMHIDGGLRRAGKRPRVMHLAELLDEGMA